MILTKKLLKNKKVKVDYDDEDHFMNFLRFKHLMDRRDRSRNRTTDRGTQTEIATNNDKATNTIDEVLGPFRLKMRSENNENNQKATQTTAMRDQETDARHSLASIRDPRVRINDSDYVLKGSEKAFKSKQQQRRDMMIHVYMATLKDEEQTPPDTDEENDRRDRELLASRLVSSMGLAGLQLGLSATSMLIHGAVNLYDAMQSQQQDASPEAREARETRDEEEEEEEIVGQDVDEINSSPPITVNSSSASSNEQDVDINDAWMRQRSRSRDGSIDPSGRSRDTTPDEGYPKKK